MKKQGLQKRKKAAGARSHRLQALEVEERQCAESLCLDLSKASLYAVLVKAFIHQENFPISQCPDEDTAKKLQEKLMKLQKSELDRIIERMGVVDPSEKRDLMQNLTKSLLYENAIEENTLESSLTEKKLLGLQKRKDSAKKSERKDYRLQALTDEEHKCVTALGLDLSEISQYICIVEEYLQRRHSSNVQNEGLSKEEISIREKLDKLQKNELAHIVDQMDQSNSEDLLNLTKSLLYEIAVGDAALEMDFLLVLPQSRQIIGNTICLYIPFSTLTRLISVHQFVLII